MTEYDSTPAGFEAYQKKQQWVGNWAQDISRHEPVNPFAPRTDIGESTFYDKPKSRTRNGHRKSKSLGTHGMQSRGYDDDSSDDGPDRPPTPTNGAPAGYMYAQTPYGQRVLVPQQGGTWQANGGYVSPPVPPYPQQSPPPTIINNSTLQPLIPTYNAQKRAWEYQPEPQSHSSSSRHRSSSKKSSRRSKRRGSVPPGLSLGQMMPGVGGYTYPGGSPPPMSSPGLYPYSASQPAMSAMYLPSAHTSPASIHHPLPYSAPVSQASLQAQQQQAAHARFQQQQQQQQQQMQYHTSSSSSRVVSPPMLPVMAGMSIPMMHMQAYGQQPMMSPPLTGMTTSYTGYPSSKTQGYLSPSNASVMSGATTQQPWGTVIVESKKKEKESGSSFLGRLTSRKKR